VRFEIGAVIHEQLNDIGPSLMRGTVQGSAALIVGDIRIDAQIEAHLHCFQTLGGGPFIRDALHPADA
jgi:hypothetical protein